MNAKISLDYEGRAEDNSSVLYAKKTFLLTSVMVLALFAYWLVCICVDWSNGTLRRTGQGQLFQQGVCELSDFWTPKMCLENGYASNGHMESGWHITNDGSEYVAGDFDKVYPAFALLPLKLFPATRAGGWTWTVLAAALYVGVLLICALNSKQKTSATTLFAIASIFSGPFIFSVERGNPIWLAAAMVAIFLLWWDDPHPWKKYFAAICLASAVASKISPVVLGALYLPGLFTAPAKYWRSVLVAVLAFLVFFFVPWLFVPDGLGGISIMLQNAANHADVVSKCPDFGLVPVFRMAYKILTGHSLIGTEPIVTCAKLLSLVFGGLIILWGAIRRDYLLLVTGMFCMAGNMLYYGALYIIPCMLLTNSFSHTKSYWVDALLMAVILCPVQFIVMDMSVTKSLCNLALLLAVFLHLLVAIIAKARSGSTCVHG